MCWQAALKQCQDLICTFAVILSIGMNEKGPTTRDVYVGGQIHGLSGWTGEN